MKPTEGLEPIIPLAEHAVVITTMAACGEWPASADRPTVFHYIPSSMGQAPSIGLGLALAQPKRRTIVINGDGSMLMNLGVLVTIGNCKPANLALVVIDNGIFEVTGGQPHAGTGTVEYCSLARGSGFRSVFEFARADDWAGQAGTVLTAPGPVFVRLAVEPRFGQPTPKPRRPMAEQVARLRQALGLPTGLGQSADALRG